MLYTIDNFPLPLLQVGDHISFTKDIKYMVGGQNLQLIEANNQAGICTNELIFTVLGMNEYKKQLFAMDVYGYLDESLFPVYRSLQDATNITNRLFDLIRREKGGKKDGLRKIEHPKYTDYIVNGQTLRLHGNPLTIIKQQENVDKVEKRLIKQAVRSRRSPTGRYTYIQESGIEPGRHQPE